MGDAWHYLTPVLAALFILCQVCYFLTFLVDLYLFSRPVDWVDVDKAHDVPVSEWPHIVLFYPVLRELEATMRTTFKALADLDYPKDKYSVIAIPNADDLDTIQSLERLGREFPFLEIVRVPDTGHPSWDAVWRAWDKTPKAYWWHQGARANDRALPAKKTRQLVYAFYNTVARRGDRGDFLVNYIDADSCPPRDHFMAAAAGMQTYDVLQAQNVAGNLNDSFAASFHALDHMAWDGKKYPHLSANGTHPYWVLGKGLFFRASDLVALGGFHPWITIEDPEVGMRFWVNGRRLGIIENPLVEEVPLTFAHGITQRKRWVCGFFQSLGEPARLMGMTRFQRLKAWMNFLPCLSLSINVIGVPTGVWALWQWLAGAQILPAWTVVLSCVNLTAFALSMAALYASTWKRTALVLDKTLDRIAYMLRVNPVFLMVWWTIWLIPLLIGYRMYRRDEGLTWERTEKVNANQQLVESHLKNGGLYMKESRVDV